MNPREMEISWRNKVARGIWGMAWWLLYRPSPALAHGWRRMLLRAFGAKIGPRAHPYPSARIWAPWNLTMGEGSCLSHFVNCYCVSPVTLGRFVTVSQYTFLCTASHDFRKRGMPLIAAPITIGDHAWVTADAFIGPGVSVGEGAVVGARAVVVGDVPEWTVVAGHPARVVGSRPRDAI